MKWHILLFTMLLCAPPALSQQVGTCAHGLASDTLDVADVRAALFNNGSFFWRSSGHVYTVPKDGNAQAIFTANLWAGGLASDGSYRITGTDFGPGEYWPGPLDEDGNPPADCDDYDRMYSVYDADVRAYEDSGALTDDLRDWPYHLGAPVVDGDGIEANYNLAGGDRPEIFGEQSVWWVMNDMGNADPLSPGSQIGLEARVQAFAASCHADPTPGLYSMQEVLSQTTYYHVTLVHKGQEPLKDFYVGWWTYGDLGNPADNFVGSDTTRQMGYFYNGDDFDEGQNGYGDRPPALGVLLAEGVDVSFDGSDNEQLPFTSFLHYVSGPTQLGNPSFRTIEPYYYLSSRWRDGTPVTFGRIGFGGTEPTRFMYPGDPVTGSYWSEENLDNNGFRSIPAHRRFVLSSGPFDFAPGDTTAFTVAIVWAQGEDRLDSITALREAADIAKESVSALMQYDTQACPPIQTQLERPNTWRNHTLRQNYPEPFSQQTTIRYEVIDTVPVQLSVYDLLGRRVRTLVDGMQEAGVYDVVFEAGDLPTGTYFYRLEAAGYVSITRRMVLQR
ncbi:MAG: T9SS type A sorting domain-containing protein [Bacteroidota bacterium]